LYTRDLSQTGAPEGLHQMEAEFITDNLTVRARVTSPETRLSDYLNGSARSVEIHPQEVRMRSGTRRNLSETMGHISKAKLVLALPLAEPDVQHDSTAWSWYLKYRCWAAVGRYHLVGDVHAENYRDPRLLLRALEQRQFLPFSNVELTYPDGTVSKRDAVIVNRWHLELLSVPKPRW
jgi:hypothetical protein